MRSCRDCARTRGTTPATPSAPRLRNTVRRFTDIIARSSRIPERPYQPQPFTMFMRARSVASTERAVTEVPEPNGAPTRREQRGPQAQEIVDGVGMVARRFAPHAVPRPGSSVCAVVHGDDVPIVDDLQVE